MIQPVLSKRNPHIRDSNLVFDEPTHKYTILTDPNSTYTSVTTWNHTHFPQFDADKIISSMMKSKSWNSQNKYWELSPDQIKAQWSQNAKMASSAGTSIHFDIECFMNQPLNPLEPYNHKRLLEKYENQIVKPISNDSKEWHYFLNFIKDFQDFTPFRTEWMIYHEELKLAGSIDMVYENEDGTLSIYDWKRSKDILKTNSFRKSAITKEISHLPDSNFWHYSLQLNTYKAIIETKYGKKVKDLFLVQLHPDKNSYKIIKCCDLSQEIAELFELRKKTV
jgi:ATP-dependent exoDNAse (exonuclease V) beta subunit